MQAVALFGAGIMGEPMAGHLLRRGFPVALVGHRNRGPIERLLAQGAREAATPAAAALRTEIAVLILPTPSEVEAVLFGPAGLVAAMRPGYTVIDMGTGYPPQTRCLAARVIERGGRFIDVPVTGGVEGARSGTLTMMAGGDTAVLELVRPVLEAFGGTIFHFGGIGQGHAAKLVQNMIGWIEVAGIAEGLALARASNLDLAAFFQMLSVSHSNSPIVQMMVPKVLAAEFDAVDFRLDLAHKDIRLAAALARETTVLPMLLANAAAELFQLARAAGFGGQDWTAVVRGLERVLKSEFRA